MVDWIHKGESKRRVKCVNCQMVYDLTRLVKVCPKCGSNAFNDCLNREFAKRSRNEK